MAHLSLELAPRLAPHGLHHARRKRWRLNISHRPFLFTTRFGISTIEAHAVSFREVSLQLGSPILARAGGQGYAARPLNIGKRRLAFNFSFTACDIGRELEQHGIEVQQKTLRCNVVGPQRFIVKAGRILMGQVKHTAI